MTWFRDAVYSHRFLVSRPGFTLAAVLTLALGVAANTAVFTVIHAVLIRPLPVFEPERLFAVSETDVPGEVRFSGCSRRTYTALLARRDVFTAVTAVYQRIANLEAGGHTGTVVSWQTDAGFFDTLKPELALGRGFRAGETEAGHPGAVVVLGHGFWQRRFGMDPYVIGRVVRIDDMPAKVIGVMPASERWLDVDVFVPFQPIVTDFQSRRMLAVIGRLNSGVTAGQAAEKLRKTAEYLARRWPETHSGYVIAVVPFYERVVSAGTRRILFLIAGAVFIVLLIACANMANLLLARAAGRRHEIAIHSVIGAGRSRLVRRLLTESTMLALPGGAGGLLLALWAVDLFRIFGAGQMPRVDVVSLGWQASVFAMAVALAAGITAGLFPALAAASGGNLNQALKEAGAGSGREGNRLRSILVVAEVALALFLLTNAALLGRSVLRASRVDPGLEVDNRLAITVNLPPARYRSGMDVVEFWRALFKRIDAVPGVKNAGATSDRWLLAGRRIVQYDADDVIGVNRRVPAAELRTVTPGYFSTLGIPILHGRVFDDGDLGPADLPPERQRPFVVVVSRTLAARQWPGESAIGKRIRPIVGNDQSYWSAVVGVVDDIRQSAVTEAPVPTVYLPEYQYAWRRLFLLVHTTGDPEVLAGIRRAITGIDPTLPTDDVVPLADLRHQSLSLERFVTFVFAAFAAFAVALAAIGVYGLIAYFVVCRAHEFGVRAALGADRRDILRLVVRQGIRLTLIGEVLGVGLALALGWPLQEVLFEISPADPATYAFVAAFLLVVSAAACLIPGWRATRVNPATALRAE